MRKTLRAHAKQVGIAPDWFHPVEDIGVYPIEIGKGLRDREPIG